MQQVIGDRQLLLTTKSDWGHDGRGEGEDIRYRARVGKRTHRIGSKMIGHIGAIIIPHQDRHIVLDGDIIRKDIHISVVPV